MTPNMTRKMTVRNIMQNKLPVLFTESISKTLFMNHKETYAEKRFIKNETKQKCVLLYANMWLMYAHFSCFGAIVEPQW